MKLDIGCGQRKKDEFIGIDKYDFTSFYRKGEFICADVTETLPLDNKSVDEIFANQLIEHIPKDKFIDFMNECYRILKVGKSFEIIFPPPINYEGKPNLDFYTDPLHINYLMGGSFACFSKEFRKFENEEENMNYNSYGIKTDFEILECTYITPGQLRIVLIKR